MDGFLGDVLRKLKNKIFENRNKTYNNNIEVLAMTVRIATIVDGG